MKINFLLLNQLKHHSFYKGKLKTAYEPKLQARLRVGQKLDCFDDPDNEFTGRCPALVITNIGWRGERLFQLTITEQMAKELKVENIKVDDEYIDDGEYIIYLTWTPACDNAPVVQLCPGCRRPLVKSLRKRREPHYGYVCLCLDTCLYGDLSEQTKEQLEELGVEYEDGREDE